jgi:hypothetical protein
MPSICILHILLEYVVHVAIMPLTGISIVPVAYMAITLHIGIVTSFIMISSPLTNNGDQNSRSTW